MVTALAGGSGCAFVHVSDSAGKPVAGAKARLLYKTELPGDVDPKELGRPVAITGLDGNMIMLLWYPSGPKLLAITKDGYNTTTVPYQRTIGRKIKLLRPGEKLSYDPPQTQPADEPETQPSEGADAAPDEADEAPVE